MAKYQQYDKYKDSGVDVLGSIPTQWKVSKLAYTFLKANAGEVIDKTYWGSGKEVLYTCNKTPLLSDYIGFPEEKRTTENDLLLTRNGTPYVHKPIEGSIYSNVVQRITLSAEFDRNYLTYCLGNSALSLKGYGVSIESFNFETWKSMQFATPSMKEQKQVVNFLDYETAQIDTLIEKQQTLIQLLREKRQAVVSHAVTKGLNSDALMKDSGVEWLGEVPEHWSVKSYRHASKIYRGKFGHRPRNDPAFYDGDYPFIQTGDVARAGKIITSYSQTLNEKGKSVSQLFPAGTLMMAIAANIGDTAILGFEAYAPDSVVGFKPYKGIDVEFLRYSFLAALPAFEQTSTQSTQANLNVDRIGTVKGAFPSHYEQEKIVIYLDNMLERYRAIEVKANEQIQLMQERRAALISAAVTGKIDVRGWRAHE